MTAVTTYPHTRVLTDPFPHRREAEMAEIQATPNFVFATAWRGSDVWELRSFGTESMIRKEQAQGWGCWHKKGQRTRVFSGAAWDALPFGRQSSDWVTLAGGQMTPRVESPRYTAPEAVER